MLCFVTSPVNRNPLENFRTPTISFCTLNKVFKLGSPVRWFRNGIIRGYKYSIIFFQNWYRLPIFLFSKVVGHRNVFVKCPAFEACWDKSHCLFFIPTIRLNNAYKKFFKSTQVLYIGLGLACTSPLQPLTIQGVRSLNGCFGNSLCIVRLQGHFCYVIA